MRRTNVHTTEHECVRLTTFTNDQNSTKQMRNRYLATPSDQHVLRLITFSKDSELLLPLTPTVFGLRQNYENIRPHIMHPI